MQVAFLQSNQRPIGGSPPTLGKLIVLNLDPCTFEEVTPQSSVTAIDSNYSELPWDSRDSIVVGICMAPMQRKALLVRNKGHLDRPYGFDRREYKDC